MLSGGPPAKARPIAPFESSPRRGGPPGFLKVLDDRTLAFADFGGNKQYISAGNLRGDDRV